MPTTPTTPTTTLEHLLETLRRRALAAATERAALLVTLLAREGWTYDGPTLRSRNGVTAKFDTVGVQITVPRRYEVTGDAEPKAVVMRIDHEVALGDLEIILRGIDFGVFAREVGLEAIAATD